MVCPLGWHHCGSPCPGRNCDRVLKLPVRNVTSVCFGGRELREMFITTAGGHSESADEEGHVFRCLAPAAGAPKFPSSIMAERKVA